MKIGIISASLREQRTSHRVALALQQVLEAKQGIEPVLIDLKEDYPILQMQEQYSEDEQATPTAHRLAQLLKDCDAFIFVTPEYHGTVTSALLNTVEYFPKSSFQGKAIGIATVSTGILGGIRAAQNAQLLVLGLWAYPIPQMLTVPQVEQKMDVAGNVTDQRFRPKIEAFLNDFTSFADIIVQRKLSLQV
jgi:NAD(P)H-dependent FMN reductase